MKLALLPLVLSPFALATAPVSAQAPRPTELLSDPAAANPFRPVVASDGDLTVVAWDTGAGGDEVFVSTSDGRGVSWSTPVQINSSASVTPNLGRRSLAVDGDSVYVVWRDERFARTELYLNASHDGGQTWIGERVVPPVVSLAPPPPTGVKESLEGWNVVTVTRADGTDAVRVVRGARSIDVSNPTNHYLVAESADGGLTFEPMNIASSDDDLAVGSATEGDVVHFAWTRNRILSPTRLLYRRSTNGGASFGPQRVLWSEPGFADWQTGSLDVEVRGNRVAIAFGLREGPTTRLYVTVSFDDGETFTEPFPVEKIRDEPDIEIAPEGFVVTWRENPSGTLRVARSIGGQVWNQQVLVANGIESSPLLDLCGSFGVIATRTATEVLVLDSEDGGVTWTSPVPVDDSAGEQVRQQSVACNALYGNVIASWKEQGPAEVRSGGYRPATVTPVFDAFSGRFELERFSPELGNVLAVVGVSASEGVGSFLLPDGRDLGLAFDALSSLAISNLGKFTAFLDADGAGQTSPLATSGVPAGTTVYAVGVGYDLALRAVSVSDVAATTF